MLTRLKKYWFYVLIGTLVIVCTGYYGSVFGQYKELNFTNEDSLIVFLVLSLFFIMFILYFVLLKKVVSLERIIEYLCENSADSSRILQEMCCKIIKKEELIIDKLPEDVVEKAQLRSLRE